MKNLNLETMKSLEGGLSNRQCLFAGAIAIGAAITGFGGAVWGIAFGSVVGGCLDDW